MTEKVDLNQLGVLLEVIELKKIFKIDLFKNATLALNGLSFKVNKGICTGLMGHNGAGKTTTIKSILGLIFPDTGRILFEGRELSIKDKFRIGYMPEVNKLAKQLTPKEILSVQIKLMKPQCTYREQRTLVIRELDKVGLLKFQNSYISKLSKGMARRVAWAQATIHAPELLILDEPFSGLDPLGQQQMANWIKEKTEAKTTILLCTHELDMAFNLCNNIVVLREGNVVYSGGSENFAQKVNVELIEFFAPQRER